VTLIHNASAGDSDHEPEELVALMKAAGYTVAYYDSKDCDIATVLGKPSDLVAVAGGDGTIRKVAAAAQPDGSPIAILPLGTANNIANSLGISGSLQDLIVGWQELRVRKFYPIEMEASWGRKRLIEGIGFGAFAQVIEEARGEEDKLSPIEARQRLAETLLRADAEELTIRADNVRLARKFVLVEITRIPLIGPNLYLAPEADPADHLLHICSVGAAKAERQPICDWLERQVADAPAPLATRSASHVAVSGRFGRIRIDDDVRSEKSAEVATITLAAAEKPLCFLVTD
jgi:diacylglycerol kinase (ATP)